jgi:hypothetical protein
MNRHCTIRNIHRLLWSIDPDAVDSNREGLSGKGNTMEVGRKKKRETDVNSPTGGLKAEWPAGKCLISRIYLT